MEIQTLVLKRYVGMADKPIDKDWQASLQVHLINMFLKYYG